MSNSIKQRVCFYAPVDDKQKLKHVGFYSQDIAALEENGFEVAIATRWKEIPWDADLYFVWWWTWAFLPMLKAKLRRRPLVITGTFNLRWGSGDYYHRPILQRLILRLMVRLASANIFVSRHEADPIRDLAWSKKVYYSPHCVDTERYSPGTAARDSNLLLTIGWLREENARRKGMFDLIEAMPRILRSNPGARLIIAGEWDSGYDQLRELATLNGSLNSIEFPGRVTDDEKIELLRTCSVYVQPSEYEGFGLAILEAMSVGCRIVTRRVGAVPEVVGDTGLYVEDFGGDLAATIVRAMDEEQSADLGSKARNRAQEDFDLSRRFRDVGEICGGLLRKSPRNQ